MSKKSKEKSDKILKEITIESLKDVEKIFQGIGSMFKNLWGFLTNPSRVFKIFILRDIDLIYDKLLKNEKLVKILAFIVALLFVISTRYDPSDFTDRFAVPISDYPLRVYADPDYEIVDSIIPDTVDLLLSGDRTQVELAQTMANYEVYADLRGLTEGTHQVELRYENINPRVSVTINPSIIIVTLDRLVEELRQVRADFMNEELVPDYYNLETPALSVNTVRISGAQGIVSEIASVRALIDVSDIDALTAYEAPVVAFDSLGNRLDVDITPATVTASVEVTTNSKTVPLEISVTGNPPEGYSISEIIVDLEEIELFGARSALDSIKSLPISIDLYQLNEDDETWIDLEAPDDIQMSEDSVKVSVVYEETTTRTFDEVTIRRRNLEAGYVIAPINPEDNIVDVTLRGAPKVLDQITETDIDVFIDLTGLVVGEHEVLIEIEIPDFVIAEVSSRRVRVNITE